MTHLNDLIPHYHNEPILIEESGQSLCYEEIENNINYLKRIIPRNSLILILCDQSTVPLIIFLSGYVQNAVSLLVDEKINKEFIDQYMEQFHFEFVFSPIDFCNDDKLKKIEQYKNFYIYRTVYSSPSMHSDLKLLLSTSGSTGSKKIVKLSRNNLIHAIKNTSESLLINTNDVAVAHLPIHFSMGLSNILCHLHKGAKVLFPQSSIIDQNFWIFIRNNHLTNFTGVPYSYEILRRIKFNNIEIPSLKVLSQGGGKLKEDLYLFLSELSKTRDLKLLLTYGMTEACGRMSFLFTKGFEKEVSIGSSICQGKMSLDNIDKENIGEIVYEGPNVCMGYAINTNDLIIGDIFQGTIATGDLAKIDQNGNFYIHARKSNIAKINGYRIHLDELEYMISKEYNCNCLCKEENQKIQIYTQDTISETELLTFLHKYTQLSPLVFNYILTNGPHFKVKKFE